MAEPTSVSKTDVFLVEHSGLNTRGRPVELKAFRFRFQKEGGSEELTASREAASGKKPDGSYSFEVPLGEFVESWKSGIWNATVAAVSVDDVEGETSPPLSVDWDPTGSKPARASIKLVVNFSAEIG